MTAKTLEVSLMYVRRTKELYWSSLLENCVKKENCIDQDVSDRYFLTFKNEERTDAVFLLSIHFLFLRKNDKNLVDVHVHDHTQDIRDYN